MNVSHFELIFKPQSPVPPAQVVLQGYFLTISNLEDVDLQFALKFTTSSISDPTRTLANNTFAIIDTGDVNNDDTFALSGSPRSKSFSLRPNITIPAHATAKVALLPRDPFPAPVGDGTADPADYEARGYVTLRLPAIVDPDGPFRQVRQLDRAAKVMLTAQNRATYFEEGAIKDQTQASLPLSSGSALTEIPQDRPFSFPKVGIIDIEDLGLVNVFERFDPQTIPARLAELMAVAAETGVDTRAFNTVLKEAGIGMALERRRVEAPAAPVSVSEDA